MSFLALIGKSRKIIFESFHNFSQSVCHRLPQFLCPRQLQSSIILMVFRTLHRLDIFQLFILIMNAEALHSNYTGRNVLQHSFPSVYLYASEHVLSCDNPIPIAKMKESEWFLVLMISIRQYYKADSNSNSNECQVNKISKIFTVIGEYLIYSQCAKSTLTHSTIPLRKAQACQNWLNPPQRFVLVSKIFAEYLECFPVFIFRTVWAERKHHKIKEHRHISVFLARPVSETRICKFLHWIYRFA